MLPIPSIDWLLLFVIVCHLLLCPFTKVEESFNTQAMHDILFHGLNVSQYDHLQFPGVVPRTFLGPIVVAGLSKPAQLMLTHLQTPKWVSLLVVRFVLGSLLFLSFRRFLSASRRVFGAATARYTCLIVCSQFHFAFYASRPLPNTFALILCLHTFACLLHEQYALSIVMATLSACIFRAELLLLYAPIYLPLLLTRRVPLLPAIAVGLCTLVVALAVSVPIDSWYWRVWLWPEAQVWWYNVVENQSHNWGTLPVHWYFTSALPRALLSSMLLIPISMWFDRRVRYIVTVSFVFVCLYSLLPHKELRFIMYVVPLLDLAAANACARIWQNRRKSTFRMLLSIGVVCHLFINLACTSLFVSAAFYNYPGGRALWHLHAHKSAERLKHHTVHIDVYNAQSGITRFLHEYEPNWIYNKTQGLDQHAKRRAQFDYILVGSDDNLAAETRYLPNYSTLFTVNGFAGVTLARLPQFPYFWPELRLKEQVAVVQRGVK